MSKRDEAALRDGGGRQGRGITGKLVSAIVASVALAVAVLLAAVYIQMSHALLEKSEAMLQATMDSAIQETRAWMNRTLTMLETQRDTIEYEDMDIPELRRYIQHTAGQSGAYPAGLYAALTDGSLYHASFVPGPDFDALQKSWYQDGVASEDFILGDVYFDEDSQSYVVGASGVLRSPGGRVRGVAAADVYLDAISQIVSGVRIEETGGIFLVDNRTDTIIGHRDSALVGSKLSEAADGMYRYADAQIAKGASGLSTYEGTYILIGQVPDSDWTAVAYVSRGEVLRELTNLTLTMLAVGLIAILAMALLVAAQVRRIIGRPVRELSAAAARIAQGELEERVAYRSKDELGALADNFNRVTLRLRDYVRYIDEVSVTLHNIAAGDLAFTLHQKYTGEFEKIKISLVEISYALGGAMEQIRAASRDVASGAEQVSSGALTLSQGSAEQAAEVEALAGHISAVSGSVQNIDRGAQRANLLSQEVKQGLIESNDKMKHMTEVIGRISEKSAEIRRIVKTIEDIAFQTNILALNAAVEAARAGSAGKGFSVVADEVRNLAAKSASAAQNTNELISRSIQSAKSGTESTDLAVSAMQDVDSCIQSIKTLMDEIAAASVQQSEMISLVETGIKEISAVVQDNSTAAEKSAAVSKELSQQARTLNSLISRFRIQ